MTNHENKGKNKRTRQSNSPENPTSLHGGSDLDAKNDKVVHDYLYGDDVSDIDDDECIQNIASDLQSIKKSAEPTENNLAKVIKASLSPSKKTSFYLHQ